MCKMWIYGTLLLWVSQFVQPFEVQYSGEDAVEEGSSFSIGCVISKYDSARWTKNRIGISSDDDYVFSEESDDDNNVHLTLKVESAKSDHSGDYRCSRFSATAHHVEVSSDDTTEVEESTDDRFGLPSVLLEINETIVLECNIASESYHVDWYKNGNRITVSKFSNKEVEGNQLIIREARRTDAGEYMCMVDDPEYEGASMGTVMHVKSEPYVEPFPEKLNVIQGRPLLLDCDAQGFPKPTISWFIGNEPLETFLQQNNLEISALSNSEGLLGAMLSIQNPISNLYTCVAENSVGTSESSVFIVVRENMILTNEELPGQGLILKVPKPLELMCNTTDDNSLNVTWLKNGNPVIISDNLHIFSENNSLVIHHTEDDDVGEYTCVVDENVNTTIEVKDDVLINGSAGHIMFESSDIHFNDILTIQEVEFDDRAYYSCEASNEVNKVKSTIYVRIKDKLAALWPFLGICLEVSILCGIIFFYEKKRVKPDASAGFKSSKAVPDNVKSKDVRQRK
ncbi:basigin-like isoform X2 [Tachypleus tridentatus]|uniref:basigin-like isoform X2 n=2 Tax=Tachypleus tridentatus TaxID=6853 RepID=UPI003FD3AC26